MRPLNAIDAISPAITRTKLLMFSPFQVGRTWKIGVTAYLTLIGGVFVPWPLLYIAMFYGYLPKDMTGKGFVTVMLAVAALLTLLYLVVYYLCSRLRFALFGMVANNEPIVTPMWGLYGRNALPWTLLKVLLGSVLMAAVCVPLTHALMKFLPTMAAIQMQPGQPPDPRFLQRLCRFMRRCLASMRSSERTCGCTRCCRTLWCLRSRWRACLCARRSGGCLRCFVRSPV